MANITMSLDEKLIKKVRKIAIDKGTTLTGLVRGYLVGIAEQDTIRREQAINELKKLYSKSKVEIGRRKWTRDELHER